MYKHFVENTSLYNNHNEITTEARYCFILEVARGKHAVQSSIVFRGVAEKAVDGNINPSYLNGSCTHTNVEENPWWRVDLGTRYDVTAVTVYNRLHFEERLDNMEIRVGKSFVKSTYSDSVAETLALSLKN